MPVKVPNNAIEMHQWINTLALAAIGFVCSLTYLKIEADHDHIFIHDKQLYGHEIRISTLEGTKDKPKEISMLLEPAMLPEKIFFNNQNKKQWNFSNK